MKTKPKHFNSGEGNSAKVKLTEAQVYEIRAQRPSPFKKSFTTIETLAKMYGVSPATISAIALRKSWTHLPEKES